MLDGKMRIASLPRALRSTIDEFICPREDIVTIWVVTRVNEVEIKDVPVLQMTENDAIRHITINLDLPYLSS